MINDQMEELAALHAVGLLDTAAESTLLRAAERDPELQQLVESYAEASTALALDVPQIAPPPTIRRELMRQISAPSATATTIVAPRVFAFPTWVPFALAACLAILTVWQEAVISGLTSKYRDARAQEVSLLNRNEMVELHLASLEAKDAAYGAAKIMVAWDPKMHRGAISMQNMPAPPPGHDYQLWALDPSKAAPASAGVLKMDPGSHAFTTTGPLNTGQPGFAISLEPSGGRSSPTGEILFAVAPGT
jgi:anti-sigma-K factor RskA